MDEDQAVTYESAYTYVTDTYAHDMYFQAHGDWIFKITKEGFEFNREAFPDWSPDDFSREIIDLLENSYAVTFERRDK